MLYKVCRGDRNFGTEKAKIVADATGTDPMLWMDSQHAAKRERFMDIITDELNIVRPKKEATP
jgi:hypothetical protein